MRYSRDSCFRTLREVAAEAHLVPGWADYRAYCTESERGLRRQAFAVLERFIIQMEQAPFDDRRRFVSWLLDRAERAEPHDGRDALVPHPLRTRVIEPTLFEWLLVEPASSEPHRWLGGYEHLKRAMQLDPTDEIARKRFVACIIGDVGYSTHELPYYGYLGNATDGLASLAEAEAAIDGFSCDDERVRAASEIAELRRLITEYLRKQWEQRAP